MKWFSKYAGAAALVILTLAALISLLVVFLPSPTAAERAAFDRWQAGQASHAGENAGEGKK